MGRLRLVPRSPFLAIPVLSVIVLSLARPALAQVPDLETFRRELAQVLVDLDQQRAVLKQTDLVKNALTQSRFDSAPPLSAVQLQLQQMTYEDLARVHDAFATAFPRWREAPQVLANVVDEVRRQQSARKGTELMVQGTSASPPSHPIIARMRSTLLRLGRTGELPRLLRSQPKGRTRSFRLLSTALR
jgi:hypothetical protein